MSLFALYKTRQAPTRAEIGDVLSGNLCRCTGYRPIVDAGVQMYAYGSGREDRHQHWMNCSFSSGTDREISQSEREMMERLRAIAGRETLVVRHGAATFYAPVTLKDLATLREEHPDARMLAGGTDVGLWVTKQHKDLPTIIYTGDVDELKAIRDTEAGLEIGAAANLTDAYEALVGQYPELSELYRRFASPPIRNAGTLGGNIANASPIGCAKAGTLATCRSTGSTPRTRRPRLRRASSSSAFGCPIACRAAICARSRSPSDSIRTSRRSAAPFGCGSITARSPTRESRTAAWRPRPSGRRRPSVRSKGGSGTNPRYA
jgi:xanthine dehydrogenase iron-sulfur cluster and FAD-binding subunit A